MYYNLKYFYSIEHNNFMRDENNQIKKLSMIDTMPTTRNTLLTRRTTGFQDSSPYPFTARKSNRGIEDIQNPQILQQQKYEKIYEQILRDTRKTFKYLSDEHDTIERDHVKKSISKVLKIGDQENEFNDRFLIKPKLRCKTARSSKNNNYIGSTHLEKEEQKRKYFFSNHKKIINLEQQCMLLEYFLKDQEGHRAKTPINYLQNLSATSRHRRLTPNAKDTSKLYNSHDFKQYKSLKKRIHLKEQFVQKCSEIARKNLTYRRKQNFREIQFILKENNKNMMNQNIFDSSTPEVHNLLQRNNMLIRLFLKYQFFVSHIKVQEYFTDKCISNFKRDLFSLNSLFYLKEKEIDDKIQVIVEYKQNKILYFQDFKELIYYIGQITKSDILALFISKFTSFFTHHSDTIFKQHRQQIDKYMTQHKITFLLNIIFNTYPDQLVGNKILPIKQIPLLFKAYGITEKDIDIHRLYISYHWMQHHDAGLTFQQFYQGSILFGMRGNNWKGIETFLKKIDIKKYI